MRRGAGRMGFSAGSSKREWKSAVFTVWFLAAEHSQLSLSYSSSVCSGRSCCISYWMKVIYSCVDHSFYFCFLCFLNDYLWRWGLGLLMIFFLSVLNFKHLFQLMVRQALCYKLSGQRQCSRSCRIVEISFLFAK